MGQSGRVRQRTGECTGVRSVRWKATLRHVHNVATCLCVALFLPRIRIQLRQPDFAPPSRCERDARRVTSTTARAPYDLAINSICITRRGPLMNKVIRISALITPRNTTRPASANSEAKRAFALVSRLSERTTGVLTSYRKFRSFRPFESNAALVRLITSTVLADVHAIQQ